MTKASFKNSLLDAIKCIPTDEMLPGDFRARIGTGDTSWPTFLEYHDVVMISEDGQPLLQWCPEAALHHQYILWGKHRYKVPWQHPIPGHWHQLDLVIRCDLSSVPQTYPSFGVDRDTDHFLSARLKCNQESYVDLNMTEVYLALTHSSWKFSCRFPEATQYIWWRPVWECGTSVVSLRTHLPSGWIAALSFGKQRTCNKDCFETNAVELASYRGKERSLLKPQPQSITKSACRSRIDKTYNAKYRQTLYWSVQDWPVPGNTNRHWTRDPRGLKASLCPTATSHHPPPLHPWRHSMAKLSLTGLFRFYAR